MHAADPSQLWLDFDPAPAESDSFAWYQPRVVRRLRFRAEVDDGLWETPWRADRATEDIRSMLFNAEEVHHGESQRAPTAPHEAQAHIGAEDAGLPSL